MDGLLSVLQLPLHKLAKATEISNRAELALGFVAKAAKCFFSQYKVSHLYLAELQNLLPPFMVTKN